MTEAEKEVVRQLGEAFNAFIALPVQHGSDANDFTRAIHDAQRVVLARPGYRAVNRVKPAMLVLPYWCVFDAGRAE